MITDVEKAKYLNDIHECFNDIEPDIYFAERLIQGFKDSYFGSSVEAFDKDQNAQANFIYGYEYMAAQIQAISNMLFDIRLKCEFVGGNKNSPIIEAHIRNEAEMVSWLRGDNKANATAGMEAKQA